MADLVSLIWFTMNVYNPTIMAGPHFSERVFDNYAECKEYIMTITKMDPFISPIDFNFGTPDGTVFRGGCWTASDWVRVQDQLGL